MSTLQERIENDSKVEFISKLVAGEDIDAYSYLIDLAGALRIIDDIFDIVVKLYDDNFYI